MMMKFGLVVVLSLALCVALVVSANMEKYNLRKGKEFLEKKAQEEGVVVLPSGLQYKVLTAGPGGKSPSASDTVSVHYRGTLIDGTEFDSSYKRGQPAQFGVGQVIRGWTEALQLMSVGDKWELYIPSELAYGEQGPGVIGPNQVLVFEVELLDVVGSGSDAQSTGKKARKHKKKQPKEEL